MTNPDGAAPAGSSLLRDWAYALRYWLGGRRGVIAALMLVAGLGIGFGWSWLVAIGIAPVLVAVLPCAAMCALGFCASRLRGPSCSSEADAQAPTPRPSAGIEASPRVPAAVPDAASPAGEAGACSRARPRDAAERTFRRDDGRERADDAGDERS